ncbi:MAG: MoxR family ATPase [Planctomycetota bacterium]|nr:MAG: MoxR family ATPase [Planctomycetota bacterium]
MPSPLHDRRSSGYDPLVSEAARAKALDIEANVRRVVRGKDDRVRLALVALFARGHLLVEDVPGTGKTVLARAIARSLDATFRRIQCTQDLLPSDMTGVSVFDPKELTFTFRPGPVFTEILLADEVNRATPRAQSALLECMEERQVTADGKTYRLSPLFFVVATQNPVELEGTFPLPEAQLDRFALQLRLGYPAQDALVEIIDAQRREHPLERLSPVADRDDLAAIQQAVTEVALDSSLARYVARVVEATRSVEGVRLGASPRAALWLARTARALAFLEGRSYVLPDDVQTVAGPVLAHRIVLEPRARLAGATAEQVLGMALHSVEVPLAPSAGPPPGA